MNTENLTILEVKGGNLYDEYDYVVMPGEPTSGLLHDTYDEYGQVLGEYAAGDYCLANSDSCMADDCKDALVEEYPEYADHEIEIDTDGTVWVDDEENEELSEWARKYDEENAEYVEAEYFNVWNGHNHESIIVGMVNDCIEYEILDDEEEEKKILAALDKYDTYVEGGTWQEEDIDGYRISNSIYQDDVFAAKIQVL